LLRMKNTLSGNLHHSAGEGRADQNPQTGNDQNDPVPCGFCASGGVEKIYGIIGNAYDQAGHGKKKQDDDHDQVSRHIPQIVVQ